LDGSVLDRPTAAFRVIPYLARRHIPIPDLPSFIDISLERLQAMKDADVADPDADEDTSEDEDSDSEDQTIALFRSPDSHLPPTQSACATGLPFSMFLVSDIFDQSSVISASGVPDSLSLSLSTNRSSPMTPSIAIFSYSALPFSLPIPTFCASPACDYRSPIFSVGIPIKICCTSFLSPLRVL
jgi:hypothetical protein